MTPATAPFDDTLGRIFGKYRLGGELGRGGMGVVYRARDQQLHRDVAIKVLGSRLRGDADAIARFGREARAAAALNHPNVAALFEAGEADGQHYLVFELVEGESLATRLAEGPLAEAEAQSILEQLAAGVAAAHAAGVIHRDLKPSNVMLGATVKLLDFGLAKLAVEGSSRGPATESGDVAGTPAYMAPEQYDSVVSDRRVDLWAIGAIAYHMLTGRPPFGWQASEIARALQSGQSPSLAGAAVSRDLGTVILQCLAFDPSRRPTSVGALVEELQRCRRGEPISARRDSMLYRVGRQWRRQRAALLVALVALVTLVATAGYGLYIRHGDAQRARLLHELGGRGLQIRTMLRRARLLPLHDTRPERAEVAALMKELADQMRRVGQEGDGPGNAALGQGWAALGDHHRARPFLEAAWAAGEHDPSVAAALGLTLATVYDEEMAKVRAVGGDQRRRAQTEELDRTLRDPALFYLASAPDAADTTPDYVAARIALLEKKYDRAVELAHRAFARSQLLYEAGELEAEALFIEGRNRWNADDKKGGRELFARSRAVADRVLEVARSDERAYTDEAERNRESVWLFSTIGEPPGPLTERVRAELGKAQQANPDSSYAYTDEAYLLITEANDESSSNHDPRVKLKQALTLAETARRLSPSDYKPLRVLGDAYAIRANYEAGNNIDPRPDFRDATTAYLASMKLRPHPETEMELADAYSDLAIWKKSHGIAFDEDLGQSITALRRVLTTDYEYPPHLQLGYALRLKALDLATSGRDPRATWQEALRELARDLELNGARPDPMCWEALVNAERALYEIRTGGSAGGWLVAAEQALAKVATSKSLDVVVASTSVHYSEAVAALAERRDPTKWLQSILHSSNPAQDVCLIRAQAELVGARTLIRRGGTPLAAALRRALVAAEDAVAIDGSSAGLLVAAEVHWRMAAGRFGDPLAHLSAARGLIVRAQGEGAGTAEMHYQRSLVERQAASLESSAPSGTERTRLADAELAQARKMDPLVDALDARLTSAGF